MSDKQNLEHVEVMGDNSDLEKTATQQARKLIPQPTNDPNDPLV